MAPNGEMSDEMETEAKMNIFALRLKIVYGGADTVRRSASLVPLCSVSCGCTDEVGLIPSVLGIGAATSAVAPSFSIMKRVADGG